MSSSDRRRGVALFVVLVVVLGACSSAGASSSPAASASMSASPTASAAAAPWSPSPSAAFPVTLRDDEGTSLEVGAEPQRIVSLTPATTEILFALGAGDRIVATDDGSDYPPEAVALQDVATYASVDVEKVVALEPDLVVAGGPRVSPPAAPPTPPPPQKPLRPLLPPPR